MEGTSRINGQVGGFAGVGQAVVSGIGIGDRHRIKVAGTTTGADRGKLVGCIGQVNRLPGSEGHQIGVSGHTQSAGLGDVPISKHSQGIIGATGEVQRATCIHRQGVGVATNVHGVNVSDAGRGEATRACAGQRYSAKIVATGCQHRCDIRVVRGQGGSAGNAKPRTTLTDVATGSHVQVYSAAAAKVDGIAITQ